MFRNLRRRAASVLRTPLPGKRTDPRSRGRTADPLRFERLEPRLVLDGGPLLISEFLADNENGQLDVDDEPSDWIEIYNPTDAPVDLDGWFLTDDVDLPMKWRFPDVTLEAGGYQVVYASGKDRTDPAGELHTNFKLASDGEYLGLILPDGAAVSHEFAPEYPEQRVEDISYGLTQERLPLISEGAEFSYLVPTAADALLSWTEPTFDDSAFGGRGPEPTILITEAGNGTPDYIEIQNVSDQTIRTEGWVVALNIGTTSDVNRVQTSYWRLPEFMAPGETLYRTDDSSSDDFIGFGILWSTASTGWAMVVDDRGGVIDFAPWYYNAVEIAGMNTTVNGFPIRASSVWKGLGVPTIANMTTLSRTGQLDRDDVSDFEFIAIDPTNLGVQNPGLIVPVASGRMAGVGFDTYPTGFGATLQTDVRTAMHNENASLWMRLAFEVDDPTVLDALNLRLKYNDGFVAYVNGHKIAEVNAPASPTWNSSAMTVRSIEASSSPEDVNLRNAVEYLVPGTNLLAIHALNVSAADGNFLIAPELFGISTNWAFRHFETPTPGMYNGESFVDFAADPEFSRQSGFYDDPFLLEMTSDSPGTTIRYTTDGTKPTKTEGEIYTTPIPIDAFTVIRAIAYSDEYRPLGVTTQTYIFLDDVLTQDGAGMPTNWGPAATNYQVDPDVVNDPRYRDTIKDDLRSIPTLSLVLDPEDLWSSATGIYANTGASGVAWERPVSAELIDGDGGTLFQVEAGLRMHGGASRNAGNLKHSFRILFKAQYGPTKLEYDWFGPDAANRFDTIILRAGFNDRAPGGNTTYLNDRWAAQTHLDMGHISGHGTWVHLYLNGLYWGLYNPVERPEASFISSYLGGDKLDYDAYVTRKLIDGNSNAWNQLRALGNNPNATFADYEAMIDMPSYIDYMMINQFGGNWDWPHNNWYATFSREGDKKWRFHSWDAEGCLQRSGDNKVVPPNSWDNGPGEFYVEMNKFDEFRMLFADHIHRQFFNDGLLTPAANIERLDRISAPMARAIVGESARWGDGYNNTSSVWTYDRWLQRLNELRFSYFPSRHSTVLSQYRSYGLYPQTAAPSFNQHGGAIPDDGFDLVITNRNNRPTDVVYYTLDGTDPRLPDGTVSPAALVSDGSTIQLTETTLVRSRTLDPTAGQSGEWSAMNEARFYAFVPASADNLVIAELNYNPYDLTQEEIDLKFTDPDSFEFVELRNTTTDQVLDLVGVRFIQGITFDFTDGTIETLEPGASVVIVKNELAFDARYGDPQQGGGIDVAGQYTGKLSNGGETLALFDRFGQPIAQFRYDDSGAWPGRADGKGATLELDDPSGDFGDPDSWRNSNEYGGSPGTDGTGWIGDVVINEVLTHTDLPKLDGIELLNTTEADVDIGGWYLSDSVGTLTKFRIPDGTILAAGAYIYFDEDNFNPSGGVDPASNPNDFGLNADHGDDVWLTETDATGKLIRFVDHVGFGAAVLGETFGRWPNGLGDLIPMITPTLSAPNSGPRVGPVIFSEVHYNPGVGGDDLEFVEIYNPTSAPVNLTNWRIRKGIDFDFAEGTILDAKSSLAILPFDPLDPANSATLATFLAVHSIDASAPMVGSYDGKLDNGGENIRLQRPGDFPDDEPDYIPRLIEDQVRYDDDGDWPLAADGFGSSLNRLATDVWGNDPASWATAVPTPGTAEVAALAEVVGRYVFYNNSAFDGNDGAADVRDDQAIAPDKRALLPGQTATSANYTNFSRGLNGVMIDFAGLADAGALSGADDFEFRVGNNANPDGWATAPDPLSIGVRVGDGVRRSDRITIRFADNAIEKQWLQVTVRATPNTGLKEPDVFYFGNAIGEAGDQTFNTIVNATDEIVARNFRHGALNPATIDDAYDYNRDRLVNGTDQVIARSNQTNPLSMLRLIAAPLPAVLFVAFNDHIGGPRTDLGATTYDARPGGIASGPLLDVATGEATEAILTITESGIVFDNQRSGLPAPGTDAYDIFNAYIDFSPAATDSIEIQGSADDHYTHTFSELDRGDALTYDFAGTAIRGSAGYTDRWTQVTLVSADSATPDHSDGMVVISPTEVAFMAGANHEVDQGFVAAWKDIDPGDDGAFSIVSTHYMGDIPGGTASQNKSYGLIAVRLEAVPTVTSKGMISKQAADTVMQQESDEIDWLYEFEQINKKNRSTAGRSPTGEAIDLLFADFDI